MEENKILENNEQVINPVSDVENAPVVEMPTEVAPVVEEAPVVEMPAEVAPVVEEAPVVEMPAEVAPVVETPVVEMPAEVAPVVEATPVVEMPAEVAPVVETTPVVEMPAEVAPVVETTPVVEMPVDVTPVVEPTAEVVVDPNAVPAVNQEGTPAVDPNAAPAAEGTAPAAPEKKKTSVLAYVALVIFVVFIVWYFFLKDKDKSPAPAPTPNPAPVVTPSDNGTENDNTQEDQNAASTETVNHEVATANKYTLVTDGKTTTLYLKPTSNTFYYVVDSEGCLSGNYGTYTQVDNTITMTSSLYFGCDACYHSSASTTMSANAVQTYTFTSSTEALDLTSANQEVFTSVGTQEVGNPFYNENVKSCDSQESAN